MFLGTVDDWTPSKLALVQTALATALGVRPGRLLLEASAGSVVVRVSIVDGAPGEPTTAQAVSTLNSLHVAGELQRKLADGGVTDVLDASQPPVLFVEPESDPPSPPPPAPPPPAPTDPPAEEPANTMLVSILAIAITTLIIILTMCVVLIVGVCQPSFLEKAMALLQRSKSNHADVNVNRV